MSWQEVQNALQDISSIESIDFRTSGTVTYSLIKRQIDFIDNVESIIEISCHILEDNAKTSPLGDDSNAMAWLLCALVTHVLLRTKSTTEPSTCNDESIHNPLTMNIPSEQSILRALNHLYLPLIATRTAKDDIDQLIHAAVQVIHITNHWNIASLLVRQSIGNINSSTIHGDADMALVHDRIMCEHPSPGSIRLAASLIHKACSKDSDDEYIKQVVHSASDEIFDQALELLLLHHTNHETQKKSLKKNKKCTSMYFGIDNALVQCLLPATLKAAHVNGCLDRCLTHLYQTCLQACQSTMSTQATGLPLLVQFSPLLVEHNIITFRTKSLWNLLFNILNSNAKDLNMKRALYILEMMIHTQQQQQQQQAAVNTECSNKNGISPADAEAKDEMNATTAQEWKAFVLLYKSMEEISIQVFTETLLALDQLHIPARVNKGDNQTGTWQSMIPFRWIVLLYKHLLAHRHMSARKMVALSFFNRAWSDELYLMLPLNFITETLLPCLGHGSIQRGEHADEIKTKSGHFVSSWTKALGKASPDKQAELLSLVIQDIKVQTQPSQLLFDGYVLHTISTVSSVHSWSKETQLQLLSEIIDAAHAQQGYGQNSIAIKIYGHLLCTAKACIPRLHGKESILAVGRLMAVIPLPLLQPCGILSNHLTSWSLTTTPTTSSTTIHAPMDSIFTSTAEGEEEMRGAAEEENSFFACIADVVAEDIKDMISCFNSLYTYETSIDANQNNNEDALFGNNSEIDKSMAVLYNRMVSTSRIALFLSLLMDNPTRHDIGGGDGFDSFFQRALAPLNNQLQATIKNEDFLSKKSARDDFLFAHFSCPLLLALLRASLPLFGSELGQQMQSDQGMRWQLPLTRWLLNTMQGNSKDDTISFAMMLSRFAGKFSNQLFSYETSTEDRLTLSNACIARCATLKIPVHESDDQDRVLLREFLDIRKRACNVMDVVAAYLRLLFLKNRRNTRDKNRDCDDGSMYPAVNELHECIWAYITKVAQNKFAAQQQHATNTLPDLLYRRIQKEIDLALFRPFSYLCHTLSYCSPKSQLDNKLQQNSHVLSALLNYLLDAVWPSNENILSFQKESLEHYMKQLRQEQYKLLSARNRRRTKIPPVTLQSWHGTLCWRALEGLVYYLNVHTHLLFSIQGHDGGCQDMVENSGVYDTPINAAAADCGGGDDGDHTVAAADCGGGDDGDHTVAAASGGGSPSSIKGIEMASRLLSASIIQLGMADKGNAALVHYIRCLRTTLPYLVAQEAEHRKRYATSSRRSNNSAMPASEMTALVAQQLHAREHSLDAIIAAIGEIMMYWLLFQARKKTGFIASIVSTCLHPCLFAHKNLYDLHRKDGGAMHCIVEQLNSEFVNSLRTSVQVNTQLAAVLLAHPWVATAYSDIVVDACLSGTEDDGHPGSMDNIIIDEPSAEELAEMMQPLDPELAAIYASSSVASRVPMICLLHAWVTNATNDENEDSNRAARAVREELLQRTLYDEDLSATHYIHGKIAHRKKIRAWQALTVLCPTLPPLQDGSPEELFDKPQGMLKLLLEQISLPNATNVKCYQEIIAAYQILKDPMLLYEHIMPVLKNYESQRVDNLTCMINLAAFAVFHHKNDDVELAREVAFALVPWITSYVHVNRTCSQLILGRILDIFPSLVEENPVFAVLKSYNEINIDMAKLKAAMGTSLGLDAFDINKATTPRSILCSNASLLGCSDQNHAQLEGTSEGLLNCITVYLASEKRLMRSDAAVVQKLSEEYEAKVGARALELTAPSHTPLPAVSGSKTGLNDNRQQKITPLEVESAISNPYRIALGLASLTNHAVREDAFESSMLCYAEEEALQSQKRSGYHQDLIIVASLIDRVPNLAGLTRTCEIFRASKLIMSDVSVMNSQEFASISVSAEHWLSVDEVSRNSLQKWLQQKAYEGYTLIGLEQTAESVPLQQYEFPRKAVLVLGAEREGISAELLALLHDTVEIPQLGVIRSLNVHVSSAIAIYEYTRQGLGGFLT